MPRPFLRQRARPAPPSDRRGVDESTAAQPVQRSTLVDRVQLSASRSMIVYLQVPEEGRGHARRGRLTETWRDGGQEIDRC